MPTSWRLVRYCWLPSWEQMFHHLWGLTRCKISGASSQTWPYFFLLVLISLPTIPYSLHTECLVSSLLSRLMQFWDLKNFFQKSFYQKSILLPMITEWCLKMWIRGSLAARRRTSKTFRTKCRSLWTIPTSVAVSLSARTTYWLQLTARRSK